jgi:hypothetical protein
VSGVTAFIADTPYVAAPGPARTGTSAARTARVGRSGSADEDRSAAVTSSRIAVRSWPLLVLAVPAAAEVWSGWVGIARLTGFGMVSPLPGIWPSLHLDTSITLPVGVEAYAAYALRAWLAGEQEVSPRTRRFAKWSALLSRWGWPGRSHRPVSGGRQPPVGPIRSTSYLLPHRPIICCRTGQAHTAA